MCQLRFLLSFFFVFAFVASVAVAVAFAFAVAAASPAVSLTATWARGAPKRLTAKTSYAYATSCLGGI